MKKRTVRVNGSAPKDPPKAVPYADIKGQGRIPYGKTAEAPMLSDTRKVMTVRGAGAAIKGKSYISC